MPGNDDQDKDKELSPALPVAEAIPAEKPPEKVKLPETPAERKKRKLAMIETESHEDRSKRRAEEFDRHVRAHQEIIKQSHEKYPAPFCTKSAPWEGFTREQKILWNDRRTDIDQANRAYHNAVRKTFADHLGEDEHLKQLRAKKEAA